MSTITLEFDPTITPDSTLPRRPLPETALAFFAALEDALEERGADFVYPDEWREGPLENDRCQYTRDGRGSCIIGLAIEKRYGFPYTGINDAASNVLEDNFPDWGDSDQDHDLGRVLYVVNNVQSLQDGRTTWGEALAAGYEELVSAYAFGHGTPAELRADVLAYRAQIQAGALS